MSMVLVLFAATTAVTVIATFKAMAMIVRLVAVEV